MQQDNTIVDTKCPTREEHATETASQKAFTRGICLFNLKQYQIAITEFDAIKKSDDQYSAACINKSICYALLGDHESGAKAIDLISSVEEGALVYDIFSTFIAMLKGESPSISVKDEKQEEAKGLISDLLRKLLELEEFEAFEGATKLFEALELEKGEISFILGKIYHNAGLSDLAAEELIQAHNEGYSDNISIFILGMAAYSQELYMDAKRLFIRALRGGFEEHDLYLYLCYSYLNLEDFGQALEVLDTAASKYPESLAIRESIQTISELLEKKEQALIDIRDRSLLKTVVSVAVGNLKKRFLGTFRRSA